MPTATLKDALRELFPSEDIHRSARNGRQTRLVKGRQEPEIEEANYLPILALILGGLILGMAVLKPPVGSAGVPRVPQMPNPNSSPETDWPQPEESSQTPYPEW